MIKLTPSLVKLVGLSTGPILPVQPIKLSNGLARCGQELLTLLSTCNGFYAFEGALHLLPAVATSSHMGLDRWNMPATWIEDYAGAAAGAYFFAEDVFGGQFCMAQYGIGIFDPETGATEPLAATLDNWNDVSADIGDANMWSINRTFLDQQIARGKTFVFTADPATAPATSYTAREAAYLRLNGYRIVPDGSMFRAVKK